MRKKVQVKSLKFSVSKFLKSFVYAIRGIGEVFRQEQNFKVHILATVLVIVFGLWLRVSPIEWCILFLTVSLVLAAEMLNTALEKLCDLTHPEQNETVRIIKDISAGMVLVCAIGALCTGLVIFLPKLIELAIAFF